MGRNRKRQKIPRAKKPLQGQTGVHAPPNSKWIQDLNIKPETLKLLKAKIGNEFQDKGIEGNFPDRTLVMQQIKPKSINGTQ